ncbi:MAG: outer membrane protein [Xanthobacteraceae bacterium]
MRYLFGIATAISLTGSAMAADLAVKAPPPFWSWTGCYAGLNIGLGWSKIGMADGRGDSLDIANGAGAAGGGQVGCDYQLSKSWVIGIEGEFDATKFEGNALDPSQQIFSNTKIPWTSTVTGRLGYAIEPITLLYVRGGAAFTRDELNEFSNVGPNLALLGSFKDSRTGWTVGGGIEHKFWGPVTAFAEYNYLQFGTATTTTTALTPFGFAPGIKASETVHEVLFGVNFHLSAPGGPVYTKY